MSVRRDIRRNALQALYQLELRKGEELDAIGESLADSPGGEEARTRGLDTAMLAWEFRDEADRAVAAVAHDWPTHRQPIVDRSILRLAHYEMTRGGVPPKVAINEAVELAKEFSTERSHLFINGVLDRIRRQIAHEEGDDAQNDAPVDSDESQPHSSVEQPPPAGA